MKVIAVDNYDRDYVSDELVAKNLSEEHARNLAIELNQKFGKHSMIYYRAVPDDYILHIWKP